MFISYIYTRLFFSFEKRPGGEPERFFRMLWIKTSSVVIVCRFPFVRFSLSYTQIYYIRKSTTHSVGNI